MEHSTAKRLYRVYNGWCGESDTRVDVIAVSESRALELARESFMAEAYEMYERDSQRAVSYHESYPATYYFSYYDNLEIELVCDDVSKEWVSKPSDG